MRNRKIRYKRHKTPRKIKSLWSSITIVIGDGYRRSNPVGAVMEAKSPEHTSEEDKNVARNYMLKMLSVKKDEQIIV